MNDVSIERSKPGWSLRLTRIIGAVLFFELVSGLAVTLGPFRPAIEWGLIFHTILGVLAIGPICWYFIRHWKTYRGQAISEVMLLGYAGAVVLAICLLSGLWVTGQAVFGVKTSPWLRYLHLVSALLGLAATLPHLAFAFWRRRNSETFRAASRWGLIAAGGTLGGAAIISLCTILYSGTAYKNRFPADYSYAYGRDHPFAPSLAETSTGGALDPRMLAGSETCGESGCHSQIYDEWKVSAHRYAAMDPVFQRIQNAMAKQSGPESTRYCGGCHDPISLFSGTKNIFAVNLTAQQGYEEGISCLACHSIEKTAIEGNAAYVMEPPPEYLWQWSPDHTLGAVARNFLIRSLPATHDRLNKRFYKSPEYCAACHKQFIDAQINHVGWVQLQNQYDNWKASHWNHKGDPQTTIECRECHMPLVVSADPASGGAFDTLDYDRHSNGEKHRSHRFLAANNFVPGLLHLDGAKQQVQLTNAWLQGRIAIPEISKKWASGPIVAMRIEAPATIEAGKTMALHVVLTSNKVGHDYPTGPLDMIQSWLEIRVVDDAGRVIFASGQRDLKDFLPPGTFFFKVEPVDQYGNLIDHHNLWDMVGVRYRRSLFPGYSDTVKYDIPAASSRLARDATNSALNPKIALSPATGGGKLHIVAILHYRKFNQFILNYLFGENSGLTAPVVDIARATATVCIVRKGRLDPCR